MNSTVFETEVKESSSLGDSGMSSTEGSSNRELRCTVAPQGAAGLDSDSVSLESLTEVSTLGFQNPKRNRCGAAKRQASRMRRVEALSGESAGGKTRQPLGGQPHQEGTSLTSGGGA
jgi:hypothetical protein